MKVIPFVHEGLGNSSYLVGLPDETALLVDPDRNVGRYLRAAADRGWRVAATFETHLHADFVSGAREMGAADGAKLFVPSGAEVRFRHDAISAGERLQIGGVEIEAVGSPGHTPEHLSYVVRAAQGPPALFSGGSLMVNGAARTDLIGPEMTGELTRRQHHTVRHAFSELPDETLLFPTHGDGSFCSAGGTGERTSTLGRERATSPVLAIEDEEEFARWFIATFPAVPAYFSRMRPINQAGPRLRGEIAPPPPLTPAEFSAAHDGGALVVDVRPAAAYMREHIPGALSNTFRDAYATWLGWLVELETPLLFVLGDEPLERVLDESMLVGFERFAGWLRGGMDAWTAASMPVAHAAFVDVARAKKVLSDGAASLDVREPDEFAAGHIEGAIPIPLGSLAGRIDEVPRDRPIVVYCGHGERATSAVSQLERAGFASLLNIDGGFDAWREAFAP
jgi:glyoxylase-like metal-dependent hydrolase (beta-lactamase superfamily II)